MMLIIEGVLLIIIGLLIMIFAWSIPHGLRIILALSRMRWMTFDEVVLLSEAPHWVTRFYLVTLTIEGNAEARLTEAYEGSILAKHGNDRTDPNARLALLQAKKNLWFTTAHLYEYRLLYQQPKRKPVEQEEPDLFGVPA